MAGERSHVELAGGKTGALIEADGRDSHLITISQLFTCLQLWQGGVTLKEAENVLKWWRLYACMNFGNVLMIVYVYLHKNNAEKNTLHQLFH